MRKQLYSAYELAHDIMSDDPGSILDMFRNSKKSLRNIVGFQSIPDESRALVDTIVICVENHVVSNQD